MRGSILRKYFKTILWACSILQINSVGTTAAETMTLADGISLALERNEQVLISQVEQERAQHSLREARSGGLPQINASIDYNRNWLLPSLVFNGNSVKIGSENTIAATLSMRQSLYTGGRNGALRTLAQQEQEAVGQAYRQARHNIIYEVEKAFYDVLVARELEEVSVIALQSARANQSQVEARRQAGRSSQYDVLRAEVQVSTTAADSIRSQNERLLAEMAFRAVIGLELGSDVEFIGDFRQNSVLDLDELGPLMDEALLNRPELLQLNYRRGQQEAQVSLEKSGQRPELSLVASAQSQFQSDRLDLTDREWRKNWATGFLLQVPLFDGRRASARVAQAKASTRQVELEWQRVERMVRLDVEQNWLRWREVNARMGAQEDAVRQAEKGLQMAESLFKTGAGTQLEVLNAQLALVQSRTGLALARRDRSMSLVSLEKAVGVLSDVGSSK